MNRKIKFNIEQPSNEDLFTGNGHLSSAIAIKKTLEQQMEIKIIGLEGELGAGKSSIIKILESKLDEHYKFIYFDISTYYHNSFKSEFIKFFSNALLDSFKDNINKNNVESATNKALGKTFVYNKETQSKINWLVFIFAISIIFSVRYFNEAANIFAGTISALLGEEIYSPSLSATITCLLGLSPLITLSINCISNWCRKRKNKKTNSIGDLLKRNSSDTITETLLINKEVGGFELKEAFEEMLHQTPSNCIVVLVLDNIDRIEKDKLGEIWSDIDIFSTANVDNFKIILPFSERHVSQALNKDDPNEGKEYISKKLPVVFKAPPVVTASWRDLFDALWLESLPEYKGIEESKKLISIWKKPEIQITPRLIKKHINDIASVVACNSTVTNAAFCSGYILACRQHNIEISKFLSSNYDSDNAAPYSKTILETHKIFDKINNKEVWVTEIACLHYQTNANIAKSELLDEPIRNGFINNLADDVIKIRNVYGYDIALTNVIDDVSYIDCIKLCASALGDNKDYIDWIKKWLPIFNTLPNTSSPLTSMDKVFVESIISLKKNGYKPNVDSLRKYKNQIETNTEVNVELFISELYLCYVALKDECPLPKIIQDPNSDTLLLLWDRRDEYKEWNVFNLSIDRDVFTQALNSKFSNNVIDFKFMRWGMKHFYIDNKRPYELFNSPDKISIQLSESFDKDTLMCLPYTKEWYDVNILSKLYSKYKEISSDSSPEHLALIDCISALILTQILQSNSFNNNISYINERTNNLVISVQDIITDVISNSNLNLENCQEHITELLPFIPIFSFLHKALASEHKNIYITPINRILTNHEKYNALNIEPIVTNEYDLYRDTLKNDDEIKNFLSNLYTWEPHYKEPKIALWSPTFISDSIKLNPTEWGMLFETEFMSLSSTIKFWLDELVNEDSFIRTYLIVIAECKKCLSNQKNAVDAMKALHANIVDLNNSHFAIRSIVEPLFSSLDLNHKKIITRHFQSKIMQLGVNQLEKQAIIISFGTLFKLKIAKDSSAQESYISLIESSTDTRVLDWIAEQDFKLTHWSEENICQLDVILGSELCRKHLSQLKETTKKLCDEFTNEQPINEIA
ncbi:P-loop NTPase fold protein [Aeromonas veronii]|uniref:P-loop NTPase fold protein n=1 Tax=Aeromonas veronii TaxID=654 RepID=UPI003BA25389